jgi:hypothetical protein
VVVDAEGQRKPTRPLAGVNGEVRVKKEKSCGKKEKKTKKRLDRADILRDVRLPHMTRSPYLYAYAASRL